MGSYCKEKEKVEREASLDKKYWELVHGSSRFNDLVRPHTPKKKKACLTCGKVEVFTNGARTCHTCQRSNAKKGALASW